MENRQIAQVFEDIADLIELQGGNPFRVRSYRNAARTVGDLSDRIEDMVNDGEDLTKLPGIGDGTAQKIKEIVETGSCEQLDELKRGMPEHLTELMHIPALGPKKVKAIYDVLGVESVEELKAACEERKIRDLEGMGAKTEENILKGIKILQSASDRILLKPASDQVHALSEILDGCDEVRQWQVAGSYRRCRETVGDLDFLIDSSDRKGTSDSILEKAGVEDVISRGNERVSVRLESGIQVDFRFFEKDAFGAALIYFTGSKAHNIAIRKIAVDNGWKLNEYGLFEGDKSVAGKTEEEVYEKLSLAWIPPELREDNGEVQAARDDKLPHLVEVDDIRGDMHCHTVATDGKNTIREMAEAARDRGYEYLAICDHSKAVRVAGGLDEKALEKHAGDIRRVDRDLDGFRLLAGVEVDILKDGSLDLDEGLLASLDWVTASIHYNFNLTLEEMTDRLLAAVNSGVVHALGHPFARQFGRRDPIQFDVDAVFKACAEKKVCLEINSQPERLDLLDTYCRKARDAGIKMVVDTDAHSTQELDIVRFGIGIARRGWLGKKDVVNCKSRSELEKFLVRG